MADSQPITSRSRHQSREGSSSWKGGRSITSHGYVLINVGKDHPLADCRGYAYEHRLVASEKLGRLVRPDEQVHHDNSNGLPDRTDNRPEKLQVVTFKQHRSLHRSEGSRVRLPDEPNPAVLCGCGCGTEFPRYDDHGRPREFVSGHNAHSSPTIDKILGILSHGQEMTLKEIIKVTAQSRKSIVVALSRMKKAKKVTNSRRGLWQRKAN